MSPDCRGDRKAARPSVVMIKPDALEHTTSAGVARLLFCDFAYFLLHRAVNPRHRGVEPTEEAVRQIRERAASEVSFRGEVLEPGILAKAFLSYSQENFREGQLNVADVLKGGLECLSDGPLDTRQITLSSYDVTMIYQGTDTDVLNDLHEYLDWHEVLLVDMGSTSVFILQWWKTFCRHFFLDYSREKYPLRNLMHVAEEDRVYLKKMMEGS